jgi:hypothetical protein
MTRIRRISLLAVAAASAVFGLTLAEPSSIHGLLFIALVAGFFASDVRGWRRPRAN